MGSGPGPVTPSTSLRSVVARHPQRIDLAAVHVDRSAMQPAAARRDDEGDEPRDVVRLTEARDVELFAVMLDGRGLVEAGALLDDVEAMAEAVGRNRTRIDGVHLHA